MQNTLFIQNKSVARISEIRSTKSLGKRVVNQNQNQNQLSELQTRQTGTRQTRNHKAKGCLVLNHYKLALHRIKINVLTVRQTDRLEYIHEDIKHTKRIMGCEKGLNNY